MAQTQAKYGSDGTLSYIKPGLGLGGVNNMWADCPLLEWQHDPTIGIHWFDDFEGYVTTHNGLTEGGDATGSAVAGADTVLTITSHSHDEDEYWVAGSTASKFTLAAGRSLWFEALVKVTQAAATSANACVGLVSLPQTAHTMQDANAGMVVDSSHIVFYKIDTGTVWNVANSTDVGAGTTTALTSVATFTSGTWYRLGFKVTSNTLITWYINGVAVGSSTTNFPTTAMSPKFNIHAGTAAADVMDVDWFRLFQLR